MAQNDPGTLPPIATSPAVGVCFIAGRVVKARRFTDKAGEKRVATLLTLPAPDAYSSPSTVEVFSTEPVGVAGDDVRVKVRVSGTRNAFSYKDEHGDNVNVLTAKHYLNVVG